MAAGKLGADVTIISRLGEDDFGQMALQTWKAANIEGDKIQLRCVQGMRSFC